MKYFVFIILLISPYFAYTQIRGRIVSAEDSSAVEFANVSIENTTVGVMGNSDGEFSLIVPKKDYGKNIIISCMGFITDTIFSPIPNEKITIRLNKDVFQLEEIIVKPIDPVKILSNALKKIYYNYFLTPVYLDAYYRETVNTDSAFVKYTDAACRIYYCGYNTPFNKAIASKKYFQINFATWNKTSPFPQAAFSVPHPDDAVKIIEARKSNNLENFTSCFGFEENLKKFDIGGGPLHVTSADIVKFRSAILDTTTWNSYHFQYAGTLKNREVHVIKFSPKGKNKQAIWRGSIYIDKKSGAFVEFDFSISPKHLKYIVAEVEQTVKLKRRERKNIKDVYVRRLTKCTNQRVRLKYAQLGKQWHISYIRIDNDYLNKGKAFDDIHYKTFTELYVNEEITKDVTPFNEEEIFNTIQSSYLFQKNYGYTPSFWETYNFPLPNKLLKDALLDIEKEQSLEEQFRKQTK